MSIVAPQSESRVVLTPVSWNTYEALLRETDRLGTRLTYDRGVLEIMAPSREHERIKTLLGWMLETTAAVMDMSISVAGSTTLKEQLKQRGIEPDECYYIANESRVRDHDNLDLAVDPPPDLAVEVDISRSSIDQLPIYAEFGVPEVWICDGETIQVHALQEDGQYRRQSRSLSFPFLPLEQLQRFLNERHRVGDAAIFRACLAWLRSLDK